MDCSPGKMIKLVDNSLNRTYRKTRREIKKMLRHMDGGVEVFFDVGSCIGMYSLLFAQKFKNIKIYSFEPVTNTYNTFVKNIEINGYEDKIKAFNFGFYNKDGYVKIGVPKDRQYEDNDGLYTIDKGNLSLANIVDAKMRHLKEFIYENNIDCIDILKMDTEGSCLVILEDSAEILSRIRYINVEINDTFKEDCKIAIFLKNVGFKKVEQYGINSFWKNMNIKEVIK